MIRVDTLFLCSFVYAFKFLIYGCNLVNQNSPMANPIAIPAKTNAVILGRYLL